MKTCVKCQRFLSIECFSKKGTTRQGEPRLQPYCQDCNREYQRGHYLANMKTYKEKATVWRRQRRSDLIGKLLEHFAEHPCVDCGETDPIVLQFDHVRGVKRTDVSKLVRDQRPWPEVAEEISKCDVRCANCHFRRTAVQLGWWRHLETKLGAVGELVEPPVFQTGHLAGSKPVRVTDPV